MPLGDVDPDGKDEAAVVGTVVASQFGWKVAEIGGEDVYLHGFFFVLLCAWLIFSGSSSSGGK